MPLFPLKEESTATHFLVGRDVFWPMLEVKVINLHWVLVGASAAEEGAGKGEEIVLDMGQAVTWPAGQAWKNLWTGQQAVLSARTR